MKTKNIFTIIVLVLTSSAFLFGCTDTTVCEGGSCTDTTNPPALPDNTENPEQGADNLQPPAFPEA